MKVITKSVKKPVAIEATLDDIHVNSALDGVMWETKQYRYNAGVSDTIEYFINGKAINPSSIKVRITPNPEEDEHNVWEKI